jgi:uncharacterized protein YgiM (DUF1202 family)
MIALTLGGLFASFYMFGGELSSTEQANLDAHRAERTSVVATLSEAFDSNPNRRAPHVPTLAELNTSNESTPNGEVLQLASFTTNTANVIPTDLSPTTAVSDPAKLSALMNSVQNPQDGMVLRSVTANRVNVRSGPSTNNSVIGSLTSSEIVRVISNPSDAWVKISIEGDGLEGYMSSQFLAALN